MRPEFDHFYDKAKHPYLRLSFYNLIPSCHICNSNLKKSLNFNTTKYVHPYLEGFDDRVLFSVKPKSIGFISGNPEDYELKLVANKRKKSSYSQLKKIVGNIHAFRLNDLYEKHKDYVDEIIQKSIVYNDDYYENIYEQHKGTLFNSVDDVKRMVLSNYIKEDELGKRTLAKLARDISLELGII